MVKNFCDLYKNNYYVRVNDLNAKEGISLSNVLSYFLDAVKDNNFYFNYFSYVKNYKKLLTSDIKSL